jgi:hypothetical protein
MAEPFEWRCEFYDGTDWRVLPSVQTVNIFRGRRLQIDDYAADVGTVTSLFPSDWTYTPKLGDRVLIYIYKPGVVTGIDEFSCFWGNIRDVDIDYGFVEDMDTVTISCEGLQADWGRAQLNAFSLVQDTTDEQILDVGTQVGLNVAQFAGRSIASAQTYTGNALDLVNTITRTEEARMYAGQTTAAFKSAETLWWFGRNKLGLNTTYNFSDGTGTTDIRDMKYEAIRFRSSADNFYNQVTITPLSVAAQVAGGVTTPIFGLQKNTVDYSTGQADDHAEWLLANFSSKNSTLAELTFTDVQQGPIAYPVPFNTNVIGLLQGAINSTGTIHFRGDAFNVVYEGIQISATPEQTRVTVFMSGQDNNAYLILNDAIYGKLDENKLGF